MLSKKKIIRQVQIALEKDAWSDALKLTNEFVKAYGEDDEALILFGDIYADMGNMQKAIESYEKAISLDPSKGASYFKLGLAYEEMDQDKFAIGQYQTALRMDPNNALYKGRLGNLMNVMGYKNKDYHMIRDGFQMLEEVVLKGQANQDIKDKLAYAYLDASLETWIEHPEKQGIVLPTEFAHLTDAREKIKQAEVLIDGTNEKLVDRVSFLRNEINNFEKTTNDGYNIIQRVPLVVGGLLLVFGNPILGIFCLFLAGLYYYSQQKPAYLMNRRFFQGKYRPPLIIRRLEEMDNYAGSWGFIGSFGNVFLMSTIFKFFYSMFRYALVMFLLPIEIIKGMIINRDLVGNVKKILKEKEDKKLEKENQQESFV